MFIRSRSLLILMTGGLLSGLWANSATAQQAAFTITTPGNAEFSNFDSNPYSAGEQFTITKTLYITALGLANVNGSSGYQTSHTVGIFDSTGKLLTSVGFTSGLSGSTVGNDTIFRYQSVNYTIGPGHYTLAFNTNGNPEMYRTDFGLQYTASSDVTFASFDGVNTPYVYQYTGINTAFVNPTGHFNPTSHIAGPNFLYSLTPSSNVPEPGTYALLGGMLVGGGSLCLRARRKK